MWETYCQKAEINHNRNHYCYYCTFLQCALHCMTLNLRILSSQPYQFKQHKTFAVEQNLPLWKGYKKNTMIKPTWNSSHKGKVKSSSKWRSNMHFETESKTLIHHQVEAREDNQVIRKAHKELRYEKAAYDGLMLMLEFSRNRKKQH